MPNSHLQLHGVTEEYCDDVRRRGYLAVAELRVEHVVAVETDPAQVAWANAFALVNVAASRVAGVQPYRTIVIMQDNRLFKLRQSVQAILTRIQDEQLLKLDAHIRKLIGPALGLHRNLAYVAGDLCLLPVTKEERNNRSWVQWKSAEMNWDYRKDGAMLSKVGCVPLLWAVSKRIVNKRVRDCQQLVDFLQGYVRMIGPKEVTLKKGWEDAHAINDVHVNYHLVRMNWAKRLAVLFSREVDEALLRLALREIEQGNYSRMPEV